MTQTIQARTIVSLGQQVADLREQVARVTAERHRLRVLLVELNEALARATRDRETA